MPDDQAGTEQLARGDREAVLRVYQQFKDDLLTVAACLLADLAGAEDCLHDLFVKLASGQVRLDPHGNLKGYLVTCIANRARDLLRHRARSAAIPLAEIADRVIAPAVPAVQALVYREEAARLCEALTRLPHEQREAIMLRLHGQFTFQQVAEHQGVSLTTAQSRYHYGLEKLRTMLGTGAPSCNR